MSTANLDSADLKGVAYGGLINEDVMQKIWDISKIPLPFTDRIGSGTCKNSYREWTTDKLQAPNTANAVVDGADITQNDTNPDETGAVSADGEPLRQGNHCQESVKAVKVSTRARNSDTIGKSDELAYQIMMRQQELRRDVEAIMLTGQASVADNGDAVAGKSAGIFAWLTVNSAKPADGVFGGFQTGTGLVTAYTPGTARALTETLVKDTVENIYTENGDPTTFMATPAVCRKFSEFLFTSSARVATLMSDVGQSPMSGVKAIGAVTEFVSDFGVVLDIVANRLQPNNGTASESHVLIFTPSMIAIDYLQGYRTEELAKTGLSDKRMMHVDWTLRVNTQRAHGAILDIDETAAVTA